MENKAAIVYAMESALQETSYGKSRNISLLYNGAVQEVEIHYTEGNEERVEYQSINGDSGMAVINDILRAIKRTDEHALDFMTL